MPPHKNSSDGMEDIRALFLLSNQIHKIKQAEKLPKLKKDFDEYFDRTVNELDESVALVQEIGQYGEEIRSSLEKFRKTIQTVSKAVSDDIMSNFTYSISRSTARPGEILEKTNIFHYMRRVQEIELRKQKLDEAIVKKQIILDKMQTEGQITMDDINNLKSAVTEWREFKVKDWEEEERKKREDEERQRQEDEERQRREEEERKKREEEERKRREEEEERKRREEEMKKREEEERERERREEKERKRREEVERKKREKEEKKRREEEKRKLREEEERKKREEEERRRREKEERKKREKEEKKRREEEKQKRREEEERKRREEEERERWEKEERKRREEERNKREEEERKRREEEERKRREEEEERKRREEEESKRREEEERRKQKEEDERRKQEAEEKRKREEERRKKEDERRRKLDEERRRREEKERARREEVERRKRLDPANWNPIMYTRKGGEVDDCRDYHKGTHGEVDDNKVYHNGVCCVVSAVPGALQEEDLECLASDEFPESESYLEDGEMIGSSVISVKSTRGKIAFQEAPARVFIPHTKAMNSNEVEVLKVSTGGKKWVESPVVSNYSQDGINLIGTEVQYIEDFKVVTVIRRRRQIIPVDHTGTNALSDIDKNIRVFIPRVAFSSQTDVKLEVIPLNDHTHEETRRLHKDCEHLESRSAMIVIQTPTPAKKDMEVIVTRNNQQADTNGRMLIVNKGTDGQWTMADTQQKERKKCVAVTLPAHRSRHVVLQLVLRSDTQSASVLDTAEALYRHVHESVACLLIRQNQAQPSLAVAHVLCRDAVPRRVEELAKRGYTEGPDISREFCISDGQYITLSCTGNIGMATEGGTIRIQFKRYMDSARQEVILHVIDQYKQRDQQSYLGHVHFNVENQKSVGRLAGGITGAVPVSLPKISLLMNALDSCTEHSLRLSCEEVLNTYKEKLTDIHLIELSENAQGDRREIGKKLGLPDNVVDECILNNPGSPVDQLFSILSTWRKSDSAILLGASAESHLIAVLHPDQP